MFSSSENSFQFFPYIKFRSHPRETIIKPLLPSVCKHELTV